MKPYRVDFWDSFDLGWSGLENDFDELSEAIAVCKRMQANLPRSNKDCGEHYGVIDLRIGREVYCPTHREGTGHEPRGWNGIRKRR